MRAASPFFLLLAAVAGALPAPAQMDEKPPVLKRSNPIPRPTEKNTEPESKQGDPNLVIASGTVRHVGEKDIVVEADDTRFLTCKVTSATTLTGPKGKLTLDDFDPGMRVKLQARISLDGEEMVASSITALATPDNPAVAAKTKDGKPAAADDGPPDEEGRPILRRGIPAKRKPTADDEEEQTVASVKAPASSSVPEAVPEARPEPVAPEAAQASLIEKARQVTAEFGGKLPNFVTQQFTTRYKRESKISGWDAVDVVSATVVFMDGKEDYQNVKVGNRSTSKGIMEIKGQRSRGDFHSVLSSLMDPRVGAEFHYVKDSELKRIKTKVYDFSVKRENSEWEIIEGGQSLRPAISGRVWIDRDSGRVVRLEQQADHIPESFPLDMVEESVDYDFVRLGERKVLLPTESENLSCERGSSFCSKNVIEFRNYKEFRGEATIQFDK